MFQACDALISAEILLTSAQQQLNTIFDVRLRDDNGIVPQPDVKDTAASLRSSDLNYVRSTLVASVSGFVAKHSIQVGSQVQSDAALP